MEQHLFVTLDWQLHLLNEGSTFLPVQSERQLMNGSQSGGFALKNDLPLTVVAVLSVPPYFRYATVAPAGGAAHINLPNKQYELNILTGHNFCNLDVGFIDGAKHRIIGGVTIKGDTTTQAIIGTSTTPDNFSIMYQNLYSTEAVRGGSLEVQRSPQGYITSGTVNGVSMSFLIDTGATFVSMSITTAQQAGVRCNHQSLNFTANGMTNACTGVASVLTFGNFRLTNVDVNILPNLVGNTLLGMNVLRQFKVELHDDKVRISSTGSDRNASPTAQSKLSGPITQIWR
jgi:clan AA aspartic protease (TIGR02281 family)